MARKPLTTHQVMKIQFDQLSRLVTNLLVENKNLKSDKPGELAYYFREFPRTEQYVSGPLARQAEHILERISETKQLCLDLAVTNEEEEILEKHQS